MNSISVVIPLLNEQETLFELVRRIDASCDGELCEIVFIDDGSTDGSWQTIEELAQARGSVRALRFRRNFGKAAALAAGFAEATGQIIITMDADLQDDPKEIPRMLAKLGEGYDVVSGWKQHRFDPWHKRWPSLVFNAILRYFSKIPLHDFNCGLKAYRKNVIKSIEVYGEMHRYIPVLAKWAGYKNIGEKVVKHSERKYGVTKFGMERFIRGPLDLLSVTFISRFVKRPMHFFGILGIIMIFIGLAASVWLGIQKIIELQHGLVGKLITNSPYFYIALTSMIIGAQFFMGGFMGELISRSASERNNYQIEKRTF